MFSCHCRKWALISIVRLVGLLLLFATALVALYDCGMTAEPGGAGGSSEMRSIEETSNEPEPTLMGGGSKPPNSTLSYSAERVSGALGTYCWRNGCVDSVGIVANRDELTVPAGSTMTFAYGGRKLDSADVAAYRIGPRNQPEEMGRSIPRATPPTASLSPSSTYNLPTVLINASSSSSVLNRCVLART